LLWDAIIIKAKIKSNNYQAGKEFQSRVGNYFWNVDLPCFAGFVFAYCIAIVSKEEEYHAFVAGVIGFQAIAALMTALRTYWEQHLKKEAPQQLLLFNKRMR
jgi:hypothetical protein